MRLRAARSRVPGVGLVLVAAVTIVGGLLASPAGAGATPGFSKTYRLPFAHLSEATLSQQDVGTCSHGALGLVPTYNRGTGSSFANASASTTACPNPASNTTDAGVYEAVEIGSRFLTFPISFPGTHRNLSINFTVSGNLTSSLQIAGSCPIATLSAKVNTEQECSLQAYSWVGVSWTLLDLDGTHVRTIGGATGIQVIAYSSVYSRSSCTARTGTCSNLTLVQTGTASGGNWSHSFVQTQTVTFDPKDLKGQGGHFLLLIELQAGAETQFSYIGKVGYLGTHGAAHVNFNSPGYGVTLHWISVT